MAWINNSQITQITYTTLYKHLELLCNDSLQLCIYMTSSHIFPPNAWKCYQDYFPSKLINSYHAMSSPVYHYTNTLWFTCLLCTKNWECIRQADINTFPLLVVLCCWMLLFCLFICHYESKTQAEQEQPQHDKVTTILMWTKRFHNLCRWILFVVVVVVVVFVVVVVVTMSFCSASYVIVDAQWQMNNNNNNNIITHEQQKQSQ